jgi:hypothetical protein
MVRRPAVGTGSKKPSLLRDYRNALAEHRRLAAYLKAAVNVLTQAECDLLAEFSELSKKKCQRLRRALGRQTAKQRSAA